MKFNGFLYFYVCTFLLTSFELHSKAVKNPLVLFVGDSLTAGYGVEQSKAFPSLIKDLAQEKHKKHIDILNGGISGSTTASALSRLKWFMKKKPQLVVLALGANDGIIGINPKTTYENLKKALEYIKQQEVRVLFCGVRVPPNYGPEFEKKFQATFKTLAKEMKVPFYSQILKDVAGEQKYNQEDGIHPNEKGHEIMAKNLLPKIMELL